MKNKKIIILLVFVLLLIILISGFLIIKKNSTNIKVTEYSLLIQPFKIESNYIQVVIEDNENTSNTTDPEKKEETSTSYKKKKDYFSNCGNGGGSSSSSSNYNYGTVTYTPKIQIPRTGIKYTIFDSMTTRNMEKGVAILYTDNGLNQPGNTVISGHNRGNGRFFSRNNRIQIGDLIYITDETGEDFAYTVTAKYITDPNDASFFDRDTEGDREITLTTCTDDGSGRIIIWASEI